MGVASYEPDSSVSVSTCRREEEEEPELHGSWKVNLDSCVLFGTCVNMSSHLHILLYSECKFANNIFTYCIVAMTILVLVLFQER